MIDGRKEEEERKKKKRRRRKAKAKAKEERITHNNTHHGLIVEIINYRLIY